MDEDDLEDIWENYLTMPKLVLVTDDDDDDDDEV